MSGVAAFGTKLRRGGTAGTVVANVTNIRGPNISLSTIDLGAHDSANSYVEKAVGRIDPGEVTIEINFDPSNATHKNATGGLRKDLADRASQSWAIEYPTTPASFDVFTAYVSGFEMSAPFDDKLSATVTLLISGAPTLA